MSSFSLLFEAKPDGVAILMGFLTLEVDNSEDLISVNLGKKYFATLLLQMWKMHCLDGKYKGSLIRIFYAFWFSKHFPRGKQG